MYFKHYGTIEIKLISFRTWFIGAAIPKGEFAKWDNQALSIPALPPSIINSRVVNVTYHVVIEVDVPWGFDPTINMPITMGTIPFRPAYQQITVPQIDPNAPPMGKKLTFSLILFIISLKLSRNKYCFISCTKC